ncbi:restriction endonuclease subunit S [Campylobacter sp.]|uniref:restriction endonuclease subunit S n=1 Tax=Campylobacter sp. TaxID=205 RepID=UPI003F9FD95D
MEKFIEELDAYLAVTGLKNYELTDAEKSAIKKFDEFDKWGGVAKEFKIGDLFEKLELKFLKNNFDKVRDISKIQTSEFDLPLVNAKDGDNGIMYYGRKRDFQSASMTIDIVNDGAVSTGNVYAQPQETGVLYNAYLVKPKTKNAHKELLLFFATSMQKSIKYKFGYENKAGWNKVKNEFIFIPTLNDKIDYEFMENFIKAIEKLVIKNVVLWADKKIEATKKVVNKA